jgi:hypothetical protein
MMHICNHEGLIECILSILATMSILEHLQASINASIDALDSPNLIRSLERSRQYLNSTVDATLHYATVP